jgi:hypothetical protein
LPSLASSAPILPPAAPQLFGGAGRQAQFIRVVIKRHVFQRGVRFERPAELIVKEGEQRVESVIT